MVKIRKKDPDFTILLTTLILLAIGLVMIFSASYIIAEESRGDPFFFLRRQTFWILLGLGGMFFFANFSYWKLRKLAPLFIIFSFILLIAIYIPGVGVEINYARRWIGIGGFTFQPAEFTKFSMVIFTAAYLSSKRVRLHDFWSSSFVPLLIMGLSFLLILKQPDLGTALAIAMTTVLIIFSAGIPLKHLLTVGGVALPALIYFMVSEEYRLKRLMSFRDPWADELGTGYQLIQSLYALGSGRIFGVGLGRSRQKLYYLPEPQNDFIFAVIAEELGLIGGIVVILLFFMLMWRGFKISLTAPDLFGSLLAVGLTMMIGLQVLVNIGVVTGSIPVTGINLPLISAGGSSVFFTLCAVGVILNISRY
ncbi:MAG: putative lipid II flippase FtsW [Dethiobacteria bacterium]|jgi:cell division protein FtsW